MPRSSPSATTTSRRSKSAWSGIPEGAGKLVVLEGVYSMLGDIAPLKEMIAVAKEQWRDGAGRRGAFDGLHRPQRPRRRRGRRASIDDVDFVIGTFSKSVGTVGGFCVSNHPKFEILRLVCRPYVFTASLPPRVVATAATSIRKLMHGADKRAHLWENSQAPARRADASSASRSAPTKPQIAIIAVIMPDLEHGAAMWEALLRRGTLRQPRPPAGDARRA